MPSHSHAASQASHAHSIVGNVSGNAVGGVVVSGCIDCSQSATIQFAGSGYEVASPNTSSATPAITVGATGSGQVHDAMQPSLVMNHIIKL